MGFLIPAGTKVPQTDGAAPTGGVGGTTTGGGGGGQTTTGTGLDGPSITFAMASRRQNGPLDVGFPDGADAHLLGFDADGHAINSLHLSKNTLWIADHIETNAKGETCPGRASEPGGCPGGDAPLEFNCWKEPEEGIYPVPVRLGFDKDSQHSWCGGPKPGLWRWWAMCNYYVAKPQGQQTGPGSTRAGSPCDIQGRPGSRVGPRGEGSGFEPFVATVVQTAGPVDLGRPNIIRPGFADLRTNTSPDARSLLAADLYTPITYRMEAYGAQGGACSGSVLGSNDGYTGKWIPGETWNYTELPGQGRFQGGTASGGVVLMPPEVDMADIDEDLDPARLQKKSTTFMIAAPGARFGAGLPNLANGAMDDGYSWFVSNGKLVFNRHTGDCPGLGVRSFEFDTAGRFLQGSSTANAFHYIVQPTSDGEGTPPKVFRVEAGAHTNLSDLGHQAEFVFNNTLSLPSGVSNDPISGLHVGRPFYAATAATRTITEAATLWVDTAPRAGNDIVITDVYGIFIESGSVISGSGTVTNAYGLFAKAPANATNNFAAGFSGNVNISSGILAVGVAPLTNMVNGDAVLGGGSLVLNEITTPTADANYGKIYTKADNKVYFQDGAGVEHEIAFV